MTTASAKSYALNGSHTAGIFADMSVDGPPIGTLVMIVDRAKNLPNRKTIGKQDPYCAARLGKEAKKTATDVRGGQTPKWDQELRFTVHDSPDYYQLKVSVFTDDKKTDLIGDSWIDLKTIIISGGGQSDMWQTLSCRGKYAGEIRVEITFYDSRPKPDKPVAKRRQPVASDQEIGSVKQRTPMKRRPLLLDPVIGEAPPSSPPSASHPADRTSPKHLQQTPPRPQAFIPAHSPIQAVEYSVPPPHVARQRPDPFPPSSPTYSAGRVEGPRPVQRPKETPEHVSRPQEEWAYGTKSPISPIDQTTQWNRPEPSLDHRRAKSGDDELRPAQPMESDRPPPPPAHRSIPSSDSQELVHRAVHETTPQKTPLTPMRHEVLRNEAHRHSAPAYPGRPTFRPLDPSLTGSHAFGPNSHVSHDSSLPSRYHSYDPTGDPHNRSMQATVEDVPESPPGGPEIPYGHYAGPRSTPPDEMMFGPNHRAESLDVARSPKASARQASQSPGYRSATYPNNHMYSTSASPQSGKDNSNSLVYHTYHGYPHGPIPGHKHDLKQAKTFPGCTLPEVPASLSPGMDPGLSQEMADHIYEERRHDHRYPALSMTTPTRPRRKSEELRRPQSNHALGPLSNPRDGRSEPVHAGTPENQLVRRANVSSGPQKAIARKSVSPEPPLAENRLLSNVPFGSDAYEVLNPGMGSPGDGRPSNTRVDPDAKIITHDGREIDPSDHLPMETWAPEPEPKPVQRRTSPEPRTRPSPVGAEPMPPSGRRPLRVAANRSMASPPAHDRPESHLAPVGSGRNRMQKRINPVPTASMPPTSNSLVPVSADMFHDRKAPYTLSGGPGRINAWDYSQMDHVLQHTPGPPIPAKVPLPFMSGGNGGSDQVSLLMEMQRVDIGPGRSRRKGGY